jgi:two-component system sensor histidine kinase UhpB
MTKPLRVLIVESSEEDAMPLVNELRRGGYDPAYERVEPSAAMITALKKIRATFALIVKRSKMKKESLA